MKTTNKSIVINFIEDIWNLNQFEKMSEYISDDFMDYSLPATLPANKKGMEQWIIGTGKSFNHKTLIETLVSENDNVIIKIKLELKHIGVWRNIEPTYLDVSTVGYRHYKLENNKIKEHWALIDGNAIENQLKRSNDLKGC